MRVAGLHNDDAIVSGLRSNGSVITTAGPNSRCGTGTNLASGGYRVATVVSLSWPELGWCLGCRIRRVEELVGGVPPLALRTAPVRHPPF